MWRHHKQPSSRRAGEPLHRRPAHQVLAGRHVHARVVAFVSAGVAAGIERRVHRDVGALRAFDRLVAGLGAAIVFAVGQDHDGAPVPVGRERIVGHRADGVEQQRACRARVPRWILAVELAQGVLQRRQVGGHALQQEHVVAEAHDERIVLRAGQHLLQERRAGHLLLGEI